MKPLVREADGSQGDLFPSEARLRNLTYAAPMQLDMTLVQGGERQEPVVTTIGLLPIMIGSSACNLSSMSPAERTVHGEDPLDPGGYFVVNGTERVLMTGSTWRKSSRSTADTVHSSWSSETRRTCSRSRSRPWPATSSSWT